MQRKRLPHTMRGPHIRWLLKWLWLNLKRYIFPAVMTGSQEPQWSRPASWESRWVVRRFSVSKIWDVWRKHLVIQCKLLKSVKVKFNILLFSVFGIMCICYNYDFQGLRISPFTYAYAEGLVLQRRPSNMFSQQPQQTYGHLRNLKSRKGFFQKSWTGAVIFSRMSNKLTSLGEFAFICLFILNKCF